MNIFGIGPLEIIFVFIIGILVLGPDGMIEAGKKMGKLMRSIIKSTWWKNIRQGMNEIQHLPHRLMREAELEELNELRKLTKDSLPSIGDQDLIKSSSWVGNSPQNISPEKGNQKDSDNQSQPEGKSE
jgi:Sec-independent protein translocase protein TatA